MTQDATDLPQVTITSDGAARGNPGPGGWAALLEANDRERLLSGEGPERTTNNAMEIMAVAAALETLRRPCRVVLRSDSTYVIEGLQRLLRGGALPEKNRELWDRLRTAARPHRLTFEWVRGHAGDQRNERVDQAANAAANRAFLMMRPADAPAGEVAVEWALALRSPSGSGPARWALVTPAGRAEGEAPTRGTTQPTAVYQALVAGMDTASRLPGAIEARLSILSNYELIVKQGRGEWKVRQPEQQRLAAKVAELRSAFAQVRFDFAPTERVEALLAGATDDA